MTTVEHRDLRRTARGDTENTGNDVITVEYCPEGWYSESGTAEHPAGQPICSSIPVSQLGTGEPDRHHVAFKVTVRFPRGRIIRWHCDDDLPPAFTLAARAEGKPRYFRGIRTADNRGWHFSVHVWPDGTAVDKYGEDATAAAAAELEKMRLRAAATRARNQERKVADAVADYLAGRLRPGNNCRVCGRVLTDDTSRRRAIGPECWQERILARAAELQAPAIKINHYGKAHVVETMPPAHDGSAS